MRLDASRNNVFNIGAAVRNRGACAASQSSIGGMDK
jgi:hypothetical protein